jgi:hypothetical protein
MASCPQGKLDVARVISSDDKNEEIDLGETIKNIPTLEVA